MNWQVLKDVMFEPFGNEMAFCSAIPVVPTGILVGSGNLTTFVIQSSARKEVMEYLVITQILSVLNDLIILRRPHFSFCLPMAISKIIFDSPQVFKFRFEWFHWAGAKGISKGLLSVWTMKKKTNQNSKTYT